MAVELEHIGVSSGDHAVQFYEHESELARSVGRYLSDALQAGGVAIVIATEPHRAAFEVELQDAGIDPAKARLDGTLIMADAAATMARFIHQGQVDEDAFRQVIGSLVRRVAETGRPIWAYGEMVALLWEAGNVTAAIDLEKAWNELAREVSFSLLCGYQSDSVLGEEHAEALDQVCHLHSCIVGAPPGEDPETRPADADITARFAAEPDAPRSARHFVADALDRWGYPRSLSDDAQLLVTELATNAVVHARSPFSVGIRRQAPGVRVSVSDASPVEPTLREAGPLATSGRGLHLVAAIAAAWGVDLTIDGKTVWTDLRPD